MDPDVTYELFIIDTWTILMIDRSIATSCEDRSLCVVCVCVCVT